MKLGDAVGLEDESLVFEELVDPRVDEPSRGVQRRRTPIHAAQCLHLPLRGWSTGDHAFEPLQGISGLDPLNIADRLCLALAPLIPKRSHERQKAFVLAWRQRLAKVTQ